MSVHLQRQFDQLKKLVLSLGTVVDESVASAVCAIDTHDPAEVKRVLAGIKRIHAMAMEIDEECLHTLALHQPVAFDLRFAVAVLKITADLKRIGDLSVNVAECAAELTDGDAAETLHHDLVPMGKQACAMLHKALDALVTVDPAKADDVLVMDDQVDQVHREMYDRIARLIRENPESVSGFIRVLGISRHFERIGDHSVNVAEDVLYMARGDIARHRQLSAMG